jgi:hypothetical protein
MKRMRYNVKMAIGMKIERGGRGIRMETERGIGMGIAREKEEKK